MPEPLRDELNRRLIAGSFSGYEALADWLVEQHCEISKSALHRYGQKFEERIRALKLSTEQAKAIVAESPDDEGAMNDALMRLTQEKLFGVLIDLELDPDTVDFPKLARAIAELTRASVQQKKWQREAREQALKEAAQRVEQAATSQGMGTEQVQFWRQQVLAGI
ncbi:DUF3486 family protein [Algiphilus sp. W345]|uniref:DUF3486 family protein n=1 Tax=Banduia mediterranea TaxID=3075609 RepID=A0ABU2WF67_9GAMM|nr:DUF3486 family protein [Algiphilus sp. W345]MDT0496515.1 DUF3486 family protein [Algiphilus sp. W345]